MCNVSWMEIACIDGGLSGCAGCWGVDRILGKRKNPHLRSEMWGTRHPGIGPEFLRRLFGGSCSLRLGLDWLHCEAESHRLQDCGEASEGGVAVFR